MNLKQAVELATAKLSSVSDSANLDARLLACHAYGIEQTQFIAHPEQTLNPEQEKLFNAILDRRTRGEPLAYITGTKEFWSLDFIVNQHVLIPRPETELLVELTLEAISNKESPRILDLGTGSGAIAISIAKERDDCKVTATDISASALKTAELNAKQHDVNIQFIRSTWFAGLVQNKFDVIVSNPPYIDITDKELDQFVSKYEPKHALISEQNGVDDLAKIINSASAYLLDTGALIVEHGFKQASEVKALFSNANFNNVSTHTDLAGHPRCISGSL
jgi:release factor glutamine methyltransferase